MYSYFSILSILSDKWIHVIQPGQSSPHSQPGHRSNATAEGSDNYHGNTEIVTENE